MKFLSTLKTIIVKFKFFVSFLLALLIALAPSFYDDYKKNKNKTKVSFKYEILKDIGLMTLASRYPHVGSLTTLIERYKLLVKEKFKNQNFTVPVVMKKPLVQIPINVAIDLLSKLHQPTIDMIKRPYIVRFSLYNNSNQSIKIQKIVIASDDAYQHPIWEVYFDYPYEKDCSIKYTLSNCLGYIVNFPKKFLLPKYKKLQIFIFFPDYPIIKVNQSFAQVSQNDGNDFLVSLTKEQRIDKFKIYKSFAIRIVVIFFIVLGLTYLLLAIIRTIHVNKNDNAQQ